MRKRAWIWALVGLASLAVGFFLTFPGVATCDSADHLARSSWLIGKYFEKLGLGPAPANIVDTLKWYGPLWELVLGVFTAVVFPVLNDPIWVRNAITLALFPASLLTTYCLLRRAGVAGSTAFLAVSFIFGMIRLGGHALVNVTDFPFAVSYWLVTLFLWVYLREKQQRGADQKGLSGRELALIGVVSIIPYLVRPPVITHFVAMLLFLFLYAKYVVGVRTRLGRLAYIGVPLASAFALMWAIWPAIWEQGFRGWLSWYHSFGEFTKYPWRGEVRIFGQTYPGEALPRWYPFPWFVISFSPLVVVGMVAGAVSCLWKGSKLVPQDFILKTRWGELNLSLRRWLLVFALVAWAGVLVVRPVLYDEDRHLLFLFPLLLILAALGLDFLKSWIKISFASAVIASAVLHYAQWGRYSYVFKSPLLPDRRASMFMGDYWGICMPPSVSRLVREAPAGTRVVAPFAPSVVMLQLERLESGFLSKVPGLGAFQLMSGPPMAEPYYLILNNRLDYLKPVFDDVRQGRALLISEELMPGGETACVLAYYLARP